MFYPYLILSFLLAGFLPSCFGGGIDKKGSVLSYRAGVVSTEGGAFRIGNPGVHWHEAPFRYKAILFKHNNYPASLSVSSFCRGSFDDAPLSILSKQAFYDLGYQKTLKSGPIQVGGRQALRVAKKGMMDGAPVVLDVVTLKMNACVFDFVLSAEESNYHEALSGFEQLIEGFEYLQGPHI